MKKDLKKITIWLGICLIFTCSSALTVWLDREGLIPKSDVEEYMRICFEKNGEFHAKAPIDPNDIYDVNVKCTCKPGYVIEFNDDGGQCVPLVNNE